jgi:hypothetical protein
LALPQRAAGKYRASYSFCIFGQVPISLLDQQFSTWHASLLVLVQTFYFRRTGFRYFLLPPKYIEARKNGRKDMRGDMGQAATGRDVIQGAKNQNHKLIGSRGIRNIIRSTSQADPWLK